MRSLLNANLAHVRCRRFLLVLRCPCEMTDDSLAVRSIKIRYVLATDQQLDRTRASTFTRNKSTFVERHDHVVDGWWRNAKVSLEVGLRRSLPVTFV